jgi:tetratricopeptide (TPR) repeat protein
MLMGLLPLLAQGAAPPRLPPPWQRQLRGPLAEQVSRLDARGERSWEAGDFRDAAEAARQILQLREREQGALHWEAVPARERVKALERAGAAAPEDREAFRAVPRLRKQADQLTARRNHRQAEPLLAQALTTCRKVLGEDCRDTAVGYHELSTALAGLGRHTAARSLGEKALAISRRVLGDDHPDTAACCTGLALILSGQGDYRAAQPLYEEALAVCRRVLGEDNAQVAAAYNNLALEQSRQGRHLAAQPLYEQSLAITRRVLGEEHPQTAGCYHNLAFNLQARDQYAAAQPLVERALAISRKVLGEKHPQTADSYYLLAINLVRQRRFAAARPLHERALAIRREKLGEGHLSTSFSYNSVALDLDRQGDHAGADLLYEKALAVARKTLGESHPQTVRIYLGRAAGLNAQGRYADARPLVERVLAATRKAVGEEHPYTANACNEFAVNLGHQRRYADAQRLLEHALAISHRAPGDQDARTALYAANLGEMFFAQGRYDRAERVWAGAAAAFARARSRAAVAGFERAEFGGAPSPLPRLAAVLARNGKPKEAWSRFEESLAQSTHEELAARLRWTPAEQDRVERLRGELDRLDRLLQASPPARPDSPLRQEERETLLGRRRRTADELDGFRRELETRHGILSGQAPDRDAVQRALPADAALLAWIDPRVALGGQDGSGERWAVLLRKTGDPAWVRLPGSGPDGVWTADDSRLATRLIQALASPRGDWRDPADRLRRQRLAPLARHLDGVRHLIVLPAPALDGVPVEVLAEGRTVSYVPSTGLFLHLHRRPAAGSTRALALADPTLDRTPAPAPPSRPAACSSGWSSPAGPPTGPGSGPATCC